MPAYVSNSAFQELWHENQLGRDHDEYGMCVVLSFCIVLAVLYHEIFIYMSQSYIYIFHFLQWITLFFSTFFDHKTHVLQMIVLIIYHEIFMYMY